MANRELVKTWKVQVTAQGVSLTVNGKEYELGGSAASIVFDLERAAEGYTVPVRKEVGREALLCSHGHTKRQVGCVSCVLVFDNWIALA